MQESHILYFAGVSPQVSEFALKRYALQVEDSAYGTSRVSRDGAGVCILLAAMTASIVEDPPV